MKIFLITAIAFLASVITCNAQWTLPGVNISNTNTGIGTTAPLAKLNVTGAQEAIRLTGIGSTGATSMGFLSFFDSDNSARRGDIGDASSVSGDLYFSADAGGGLN